MTPSSESVKAQVVQFSDETRTLPDGSKIVYAESDDMIVLHHQIPFEAGSIYSYNRKTGQIFINGKEGSNADKKKMIHLGTYFLSHASEDDLVTIDVQDKGKS